MTAHISSTQMLLKSILVGILSLFSTPAAEGQDHNLFRMYENWQQSVISQPFQIPRRLPPVPEPIEELNQLLRSPEEWLKSCYRRHRDRVKGEIEQHLRYHNLSHAFAGPFGLHGMAAVYLDLGALQRSSGNLSLYHVGALGETYVFLLIDETAVQGNFRQTGEYHRLHGAFDKGSCSFEGAVGDGFKFKGAFRPDGYNCQGVLNYGAPLRGAFLIQNDNIFAGFDSQLGPLTTALKYSREGHTDQFFGDLGLNFYHELHAIPGYSLQGSFAAQPTFSDLIKRGPRWNCPAKGKMQIQGPRNNNVILIFAIPDLIDLWRQHDLQIQGIFRY